MPGYGSNQRMKLEEVFDRTVLEWCLAIVIVILTVVTYMVLAGIGVTTQSNSIMLAILIIILISVTVLNSIIGLRMLDALEDR